MGKNDKKSGDKGGAKGKGAESKESGGKTKGAMSINVRHILVRPAVAVVKYTGSASLSIIYME
jgi:hypothetical protein